MDTRLTLRRHLYEQRARARRLSARRRMLGRQIALIGPDERPDGGPAGVREPRRPAPGSGPARTALRNP